jgi:predicted ATPase/DNA-binding SARP family transcriptional activator
VGIDGSGAPGSLSPTLRLVLALLAGQPGMVVSTDRLCDAIWETHLPAAPSATLQSHVSRLRRLLGSVGDVVSVDRGYRLDLPRGAIDVDQFTRLLHEAESTSDPAEGAERYRSALGWWRGPAFGELANHEWIRPEAVRLDEMRQSTTEAWIECRLAVGRDASLVSDLEGLVAANPLRERFLRQLMIALVREGRGAEALQRAHQFRLLLRDDMGLDPSPSLRTIEGQVLADDPVLLGPMRPAAPDAHPQPLTDDPTRLVGRNDDLARIADAFTTTRLVTLVGTGGVGKTRLARRVANLARSFSEGAVFVELAAVNGTESVADALATALDVQPRHNLSIEDTVIAALAERHQFVVLDNCEHLLNALVPFIDRIRSRCGRVSLLATSREPLGLTNEVVLTISPLAVAADDVDDPESVAASPAVQLLVDRVAATVPGFTVTAANAGVLSEICRRLDGLPLALELVAPRFRSLSPEAVLQRIAVPTAMLDASMRSADPRHRTLRDTIAWSFHHLNSAEQAMFARLSIFAGTFDIPAVHAICADGDAHDIESSDLIDVLASLVDKSMVQLVNRDTTRYQMLETLREFGREQVVQLGCAEQTGDAHLRWFTELAERAACGLAGPDEARWSRDIEADLDNFRAAHRRASQSNDADAALRLVAGLREFAFRRIRYELTTWAATSLNIPLAKTHTKYAVVEAMVAYGHYVRGDLASSLAVAGEALGREGLDTHGLAERTLGNALGFLGRFDEALLWMDRMVTSARGRSPSRLAHALYMRSVAETSVGRTVQGAILAGEARAVADASGSPTARAQAAYALGLALEGTDPTESLRLLRYSAELAGQAGNRWIEAFAQTEVWWLEARNGDVSSSLIGSSRVLDTWHRGGDWPNLYLSLRRVFGLLVQVSDYDAAAVVHGALIEAGATTALPFEPRDAQAMDVAVDQLRSALGPGRFEAAVETGTRLTESALVAFVQDRITGRTGSAS